jgi:hypothetical protein
MTIHQDPTNPPTPARVLGDLLPDRLARFVDADTLAVPVPTQAELHTVIPGRASWWAVNLFLAAWVAAVVVLGSVELVVLLSGWAGITSTGLPGPVLAGFWVVGTPGLGFASALDRVARHRDQLNGTPS